MAIEIIPLNGKSPYIDYEAFEESVHKVLHYTCTNAKVYIFNKIPIPISTDVDIDLLLVLIIENKDKNYYKIDENRSFYNQIIPIKFLTKYKNDKLYMSGDNNDFLFLTENAEINFSEEIISLKKGLKEYLSKIIGEDNIFINHPIFFIFNNEYKAISNNYLLGSSFDFMFLDEYFRENQKEKYFCSVKKWKEDGGYEVVDFDIRKIIDRMSKDSEYGFITRKKIDAITNKKNKIDHLKEIIGNRLIIVIGKAGTGKTNRLLSLANMCINRGSGIIFLTYNRLLVYDINMTLRNICYQKKNNPIVRINTYHSFFFEICKELGILDLEKEKRYKELILKLERSTKEIFDILNHLNLDSFNENTLKTYFQNFENLDKGTKEYAVDYIDDIGYYIQDSTNINNQKKFLNKKKEAIRETYFSRSDKNNGIKLFIKDYEKYIRILYKSFNNIEEYYNEYDVENKYDILETSLALNSKREYIVNSDKKITLKGLSEHIYRVKNTLLNKYNILFVDEAQDCYEYEKELLINIFGRNNIIIANGGKEQLIQYDTLCKWKTTDDDYEHKLSSISYRSKEEIINFCNFIARKGDIDFKLKSTKSENIFGEDYDTGEIIFDFSKKNNILDLYENLKKKAFINGCKPYESILTLITPEDEQEENSEGEQKENSEGVSHKNKTRINENNFVSTTDIKEKKGSWKYFKLLEDNGYQCYNGTKSKNNIFSFDENRIIHYESCRGLEAWSVCCFRLDYFFNFKYGEKKAERFSLSEKKYNNQDLTNEKRKLIYATNWLLMALTRAIDTLYIQINDKNSYIGKLVCEYIEMNKDNKNIKVYE